MAQRFQMLFIDAVDTLLRVRGSVGAIYTSIAARHGMDATATTIEAQFRAALTTAPPALFPDATPDEIGTRERAWWRAVVARTMAPLDASPTFDQFFDTVFAHFATAAPWEFFPDARATLMQLRQSGRRLGIVSEMDGRLYAVLADAGMADLFDVVALSSRLHASKHDGGLFRAALELAGVQPSRALHVGDSRHNDIEGARRAGIIPVLFDPNARHPPTADVAVLRAWRDLPDRVAQFEQR